MDEPQYMGERERRLWERIRGLESQLIAEREQVAWLLEYVTEPIEFPNQGDRYYWNEKLMSIQAKARA